LHYFDWLSQRPKVQSAFNTTMAIARQGRGPEWFDFYPVEERLSIPNVDAASILLVDIGENVGHDLINFHEKFPNLPGRLIFEDLPQVVASAQHLPKGIEGIGHDFFQSQPQPYATRKRTISEMFFMTGPMSRQDKSSKTSVR
jgi:hypothetical protein